MSRSQWGARAPKSTTALSSSLQKGLAFHWEGPGLGQFAHTSCAGKLRSIQNYHMDRQQWADIAYNFVVCPHGYIFEGRGWGRRSAANGTNAGNDAYHAVCYLGGTGDPFTSEAQNQFRAVRDEWVRRYGRTCDVKPHSSFVSTECPGNAIRQFIVSGLGSAPSPAPVGVKPMYDPPLQVAAVWKDEAGRVLAGISPGGHVFAWGTPFYGNVAGRSWWGNRVAAAIGPRPDGLVGYRVTATTGQTYDLPNDTP